MQESAVSGGRGSLYRAMCTEVAQSSLLRARTAVQGGDMGLWELPRAGQLAQSPSVQCQAGWQGRAGLLWRTR